MTTQFLISPDSVLSCKPPAKVKLVDGDFDKTLTISDNLHGSFIQGNLSVERVLQCPNGVMTCQFSPDGSLVAVGLTNGTIKLYDTLCGAVVHSLSDEDTLAYRLPVTQIHFYPYNSLGKDDSTNVLLASYAAGFFKYWHFTSSSCLATIIEDGEILTLNLSPDGSKVITGGSEATISVYDLASRARLMRCESSDNHSVMDGHVFRIFALRYHSVDAPNIFISGGWDNTIQYWDDRSSHSFRKIHGPHICGDAVDIDVTYNHILTGSWRKNSALQVWDFLSGKLIKDIPQEPMTESHLYCAKWMGKDSIVCGGSDSNLAYMTDRATLNVTGQLRDLSKAVYAIDIDYSGIHPRLAVATDNLLFIMKEEKS